MNTDNVESLGSGGNVDFSCQLMQELKIGGIEDFGEAACQGVGLGEVFLKSFEHAEFFGWIPCVAGALDFGLTRVGLSGYFGVDTRNDFRRFIENFTSTIKFSSNPFKNARLQEEYFSTVVDANLRGEIEKSRNFRKIYLSSHVNWKDDETIHSDYGWYEVDVIAKTTREDDGQAGVLEGYLLFRPALLTHLGMINQFASDFQVLADSLRGAAFEATSNVRKKSCLDDYDEGFNQSFNGMWDWLERKTYVLDNPLIPLIKFTVAANGLMTLSCGGKLTNRQKYTYARQAYYYIKYAIHNHKFHHQDHDSILNAVEFKFEHRDKHAMELIAQLKRAIIKAHRQEQMVAHESFKDELLSMSRGIVHYSRSLLTTLLHCSLIKKTTFDLEVAYFGNVLGALDTSLQSRAQKRSLEQFAVTVGLGCASITVAILIAVYTSFVGKSQLESSLEFPGLVLAATCLLVFVPIVLLGRSVVLNKNSSSFRFKSRFRDLFYSLSGAFIALLSIYLISVDFAVLESVAVNFLKLVG